MNDIDLSRQEGESELAYLWRLGELKYNGIIEMTWDELAEVLNRNLRDSEEEYLGSSAYRKRYSVMKQAKDEVFATDDSDVSLCEEIVALRQELEKERVKIRDERTAYKKLIREQARKETLLEQIDYIFANHITEPIEPPQSNYLKSTVGPDLLIPITDVHAGELIDNFWNKYDNDIMRQRFAKYLARIKEIQMTHDAVNAYIVISEIVSGIIHMQTRLESNENVIEQFLSAMNVLIWFLSEMSEMFVEVHVYVAPGNHSRVFQNKEDNRKAENFDNLAIHYLRGYMQNIANVHFHENAVDESIVMFRMCKDITVVSVHGDKDTPENVCRNITELVGVVPNIALLGHRHTNALVTANGGCKVIQSGSFSATNNYCIDHRLKGRPEQAVAVVNEKGLVCLYDIDLM